MKDNKRVAVFIDAENISAKFADKLIAETSNYGDVIVRRVFADWSSPNVKEWQDVVKRHSLMAEQQFSPVKGKNSGDISLIINAMIVLFERDIDVFCLASSDSDFTRLVQELREREKTVIGFGLKQTSMAFVNAFSEFIYLDSENKEKTELSDETKDKNESHKTENRGCSLLESDRMDALKDIIDKLIEDDGRALYARISTEMKNKFSDFVPKNYGCKSLKELIEKNIKKLGCYAIKTDSDGTTMFLVADEVCRLNLVNENLAKKEGERETLKDGHKDVKGGGYINNSGKTFSKPLLKSGGGNNRLSSKKKVEVLKDGKKTRSSSQDKNAKNNNSLKRGAKTQRRRTSTNKKSE